MEFPILGITPDQIQYTETGLRYGYYLFEMISGKIGQDLGLYYLALTAGMVGTVLLLLNPKFQKLPIVGCWILLIFITIIGPHASSIFFYRDNITSNASYLKGFNPQIVAIHTFSTLHKSVYNAMFDCVEDGEGNRECNVMDPISQAFNAGDLSNLPEMKIKDGSIPAEAALYESASCGRAARDIPLLPYTPERYAKNPAITMPPERHDVLTEQGFTFDDVLQANQRFFTNPSEFNKTGRPPFGVVFSDEEYAASLEKISKYKVKLEENQDFFEGKNLGAFLLEPNPGKGASSSAPYQARTRSIQHNFEDIWRTDFNIKDEYKQLVTFEEMPVKIATVRQNKDPQTGKPVVPPAEGLNAINALAYGGVVHLREGSKYSIQGKDLNYSNGLIKNCAQLHESLHDRMLLNLASNVGMGENVFKYLISGNAAADSNSPAQKAFKKYYRDTFLSQTTNPRDPDVAADETKFALLTLAINRNLDKVKPLLKDQVAEDIQNSEDDDVFSLVGGDFLGNVAILVGKIGVAVGAVFTGAEAIAYIYFLKLFVNMALLAILVVTPLIYIMGILIPGYAPGVLIITIGSVVILKMVPVTYTIIDAIIKIMFDVLQTFSEGGVKWFQLDQALLIHAAAALYTSIIGITLFIMFKIGDPSSLQHLTQLDNKAKDIANTAENAAKAIAITGAAMATGGVSGLVGGVKGAREKGKGTWDTIKAGGRGLVVQGSQPVTRSASNIPGLSQFLKEASPTDAYQEGKIMEREFFGKGDGQSLGDYSRTIGEQKHDAEVRRMQAMYQQSDEDQRAIKDKNAAEGIYGDQKTFAKALSLKEAGDPTARRDADGKMQEFESRYVDATRLYAQGLMKQNPGLSEKEAAEAASAQMRIIMKHEAGTGNEILVKQELTDSQGNTHVGYQINKSNDPVVQKVVVELEENIKRVKKEGALSTFSHVGSSGATENFANFRSTGDYTPVRSASQPATATAATASSPAGGGASAGGGGASAADLNNVAREIADAAKSMKDAARDMKNMQNMTGYASNRPVHKSAVVKKKK